MASTHKLQYGSTSIEYTLTYGARKTLAIDVHPNLRVTVQAPEDADLADIMARVRKKAPWILRQQRRFETYLPQLPPRQYVSGETHRYLGRQYRLKVMEDERDEVKLTRGYFYIKVPDKNDTEQVKALLTEWYRRRARRIFQERLEVCLAKVRFLELDYPDLTIRQMETRWGSCTPEGKIILNLKLIQVPKLYIDYVIMHELCHLKEHNHSRRYYDLLNRVMPDWREKRQKLNEFEVS
jgi:predicted metal-dependent hydrolase